MPNIIEIPGHEKVCCNCNGFHVLCTSDGTPHFMGHCSWTCQKYRAATDSCTKFRERGNTGGAGPLWWDTRQWEETKRQRRRAAGA